MPGRFAHCHALARVALVAAALAVCAAVSDGQAQEPRQPPPLVALDSHKLTLDQIENAFAREGLGNEALVDLRARIAPVREELRAKLETFEPKFAEIDTRLKQLGAAPAPGAPAEDAGITAERGDIAKLHRELDGAIKQAKLLTLRADQINDRITERRRSLFTRELLQRSSSILDPSFWGHAGEAVSYEMRSIGLLFRSWRNYASENGGVAGLAGAIVALAAAAASAAALRRWLRRLWRARRSAATQFAKASTALMVLGRVSLVAPLLVAAVLWAFSSFGLVPARILEIGWGLVVAVAVASFGRAVGAALFAPGEADRRLLDVDEPTARSLDRHLAWAMGVLGAVIFLNVVHKAVVAPVALTIATSALLAAAIAGLLVSVVVGLAGLAKSEEPSRVQWLRFIGWNLAAVIVALLVTGHIGLAAFIAGRLLTLAVVAGALYVLLVFTDALFTEALSSDTAGGRRLASMLGLKPRTVEVVGVLVSGAVRIGLILAAVLAVIGPWGILAADFFGALEGAVFGFKVGEITLSLTAILGGLVVLLIGLAVTRALQRWLQLKFLPRTGLEPSLQLSISTIVGYVGFIAAVALALSELGIDLQKIALVAGALSVGIGFGLQSIVSNFVSGLILLAERPIRVGDSIVVKGEEGYVRRISVRATEIETFERASVIVPNSELITGVVKNWTHANTTGRIIVKLGVAYDSDAERVREVLTEVAVEHPQVLRTPPPRVFLMGFGDSALEFELRCVVANVDYALIVKSDLHFAILRRFRDAGIEIPFPQREVRVRQERPAAAIVAINTGAALRSSEG